MGHLRCFPRVRAASAYPPKLTVKADVFGLERHAVEACPVLACELVRSGPLGSRFQATETRHRHPDSSEKYPSHPNKSQTTPPKTPGLISQRHRARSR